MTTRKPIPWSPAWAEHPGDLIRESLREQGLSQEAAAERAGVSQVYLSGLITGRRAITPRAALHLERATGMKAELLARMYTDWAVAVERQKAA